MASNRVQISEEVLAGAEADAPSRTFAYASGEGEAWWWLGALATIKATKEQTGGRYTLVEILAPEGYPGVLHVHHQEDEGFWILEGELTFYVGDQVLKARPGSFLFGPKDVPRAPIDHEARAPIHGQTAIAAYRGPPQVAGWPSLGHLPLRGYVA